MRRLLGAAVAALVTVLAGCAAPPPPPPPPPVVVIPPRPRPPLGAAENLVIPPMNAYGLRVTVNSNLSAAQTVWNLRSAYNVAALNCKSVEHAPILAGYSQFLTVHKKALATANKDLDKTFRDNFGAKTAIRERETYNTQVYNYFALPPVTPSLCNAALQVSSDLATVPAGQLEAYATGGLDKIDLPFREFFTSYDQYRADLRAWESRYGAGPPVLISVPAPVQTVPTTQGS